VRALKIFIISSFGVFKLLKVLGRANAVVRVKLFSCTNKDFCLCIVPSQAAKKLIDRLCDVKNFRFPMKFIKFTTSESGTLHGRMHCGGCTEITREPSDNPNVGRRIQNPIETSHVRARGSGRAFPLRVPLALRFYNQRRDASPFAGFLFQRSLKLSAARIFI
jgi:hypothetical protein